MINALITGGSRGIGNAIATKLAPRCSNLLLTATDATRLAKSAASVASVTPSTCVEILARDLRDGRLAAVDIANWAAECVPELDMLVLNAGYYVEASLAEVPEEIMRQNLEVNFLVNHFLIQELLQLLRASTRHATIVIIGSTAAYEAYPLVPTYGIAKWALRGLAMNWRAELAKEAIRVSFISPGPTWTSMWEGEELPEDRLLEPTDVATLVDSLCDLSGQAVADEVILRPLLGDIHE